MALTYQSTRGQAPELDFYGVTMAGLAADGGLYLPKIWPQFSTSELAALAGVPYREAAARVLRPFVAPMLKDEVLSHLLQVAYASFVDPAITPLRQLDDRRWILELFHGPTLAFKDVALQFLGHLFEHFLSHNGQRLTVIGATSGDTGSAAIAALANRKNIDVFILYPHGRPSEIQRKQMTCVDAPNVHAMAIEGSFDDCQAIVKNLFNNASFRSQYNLAAVNSINWARILAQIVYYFFAAVKLGAPEKAVSFVVPTGNFGNVFAGYAAMKCGLPISKLAVASNRNDILTRFFASGTMQTEVVHATLSPSMDIQISSNFERLLFDLCQGNAGTVTTLTEELRKDGVFSISKHQLAMARQVFSAGTADDTETIKAIKDTYDNSGILLDPHTAVGLAVGGKLSRELPDPVVMLACAHPAKFPETIQRAIGITPELPAPVAALLRQPERLSLLPANVLTVQNFIAARVAS